MEFPISCLFLVSFLIYLFFGIFILKLNPGASANRLFFTVCLCFAQWTLFYAAKHCGHAPGGIWFWYRWSHIGKILFTGFIVHFFLSLTRKNTEYSPAARKLLYAAVYAPAVYFAYSGVAGGMGADDLIYRGGFLLQVWDKTSPVFLAYTAWYLCMMAFSIFIVSDWRKRTGHKHEKIQAGIILISGITAFALASTVNFLFVFIDFEFPAVGSVIALIWIFGIWYAITNYGFLKINPRLAVNSILDSLQDAIILTDENGLISWTNPEAEALTGRGREELTGSEIEKLLGPEGPAFEDIKNTTRPEEIFIASKKERCARHASFTASSIRKDGKTLGYVFSFRDISAEKEAELALRESEKRFRDIADAAGEYIWELDGEFRHVYLSDKVEDIAKIPKEAILGRTPFEFMVPEDAERMKNAARDLIERGERKAEIECRFILPDGDIVWIEIRAVAIFDERGEVAGYRGTSLDITERKKNEMEMKALSEERSLLLNNIPTHIWYMKDAGTYGFANSAHLEFLGLAIEDVEGRDIKDILPPAEAREMIKSNEEVLSSGERKMVEQAVTDGSGEKRLLGMAKIPVTDSRGNTGRILCTAADITDKKLAEQRIRESIKIKENFISIVSHELRTPLTIIKEGILVVLDGLAGPLNGKQRDLLGKVDKNIERLSRLISDVLDFRKIESGEMRLQLEENDLNSTAAEAMEFMRKKAARKGIKLKIELEKTIPPFKFDSDKITQAFLNLIDNSVKFTESGTISIRTEKINEEVRISVADTGKGISDINPEKLFDLFEQGGSILTGKPGGFGLGLAITKQIVELHGGQISARANEGKGAVFSFSLPVKK